MKILYYKTAYQVVREGKQAKGVFCIHVCGSRMLSCAVCNRIFCSQCDYLTVSMANKCCNKAIDAYTEDEDNKLKNREEIKLHRSKRPRKLPYRKFKIKIEEIDNKL